MACVSSPKIGGRPSFHTVKKGETLYAIAWRYKLDYKKLALWNGIQKPYIIYPGQKVRLYRSSKVRTSQKYSVNTVPKNATTKKKQAAKQVDRSKTRPARSVKKVAENDKPLPWRWPVNGKVIKKFAASGSGKKGIDIVGIPGQTIKASLSGKVVYSGSGLRGYGQLIIIKHEQNFLSAYAHNRKLMVKEGEFVKSGQKIAELGSSGTDKPKLHFEIRREGVPVDPLRYLPRR